MLTFIDFFAGIGGFRRGMELAGHKCVGFCEWDKYAVMSYTSMHLITEEQREYLLSLPFKARQKEILKEEFRNGEWYANDITRVLPGSLPKSDVWCFGAPCQDFSLAGDRKGLEGDKSVLVRRVFELNSELKIEDKPKYLIYENVKGMLSSNKGWDYACILTEMEQLGYDIEYELLNSKNFGVPQNRERVFTIGHLRGRSGGKVFPLGESSGIHNKTGENEEIYEIAQCLTAGGDDKWQGDYIVKQIGNCMPTATRNNPNQGRIYDPKGLAPCLNKMDGGGREPLIPISMTQKTYKATDIANTLTANGTCSGRGNYSPVNGVMIREATKQGYSIAKPGDSINLEQPNSKTRRGRVGKGVAQTLTTGCNQAVIWGGLQEHQTPRKDGISPCLTSAMGMGGGQTPVLKQGMRIRKIIPLECFRLQGWEDIYFERAAMVNSDSQLYKEAGNGVTVNVIQAIAERL